jgi:serine/threonine protein kinase
VSPEAEKHIVPASKMCLACSQEFQGDIATCPNDGTSLIALNKQDPFLGKTLADRYHLTEIIGKGGMGVVYLARHEMMDRLVALKMLQAELTQDEMSVKRFQQEAKAASHLNHPHLITLHDFGILPTGQPFLVMEYLEGVSLLDVLRGEGPLEPKRAVKIFSEVADGLYHAHKVGILHRDLKPSNIILVNNQGDQDFVKIVDFGLAKLMPWSGKESQHLTKTGEVFGSPIYMSPEQCMGKQLWPTSDIYSLGITLFEALTGKPPFRGANSIQTASKHMTEAPPRLMDVRPDLPLPEGFERVIQKCLQKNGEDRFQDMAEFKDALQASLNSDRVQMPESLMVSTRAIPAIQAQMPPPSVVRKAIQPEPPKEPKSIHPGVFIGAGVLALAGIAAFCFIPVPGTAQGVITYYELSSPGVVHIQGEGRLTKLRLNGEPPFMHDNANEACLGSTVNADYSHNRFGDGSNGTLSELRFTPNGKPDGHPTAAVATVNELLTYIADNAQPQFKDQTRYDQTVVSKFLADNPGPYFYLPAKARRRMVQKEGAPQEPEIIDDRAHRDGDLQFADAIRPAHAFKLLSGANDKYTVLVNPSFFLTAPDQAGFWKFELDRDGDNWAIKKYEKIPESEWSQL